MKIVIGINASNYGCTGLINRGILDLAEKNGYKTYSACAKSRSTTRIKMSGQIFIGTIVGRCLHRIISLFTGYHGIGSVIDTFIFLRKLDKLEPQIIHLHNLHDSFINLPMLFKHFKKHRKTQVVWTLHDCWAFTGDCPHFTILDCEKWKTNCTACQYRGWPKGKIDRTEQLYKLKKKWFMNVEKLTIVTPSQWLSDLTRYSFLKSYPVKTIPNGINSDIFKPTESDFRKQYRLEDKIIVLGVATSWGYKKGLDRIEKLARQLPIEYQIVLVGLTPTINEEVKNRILAVGTISDQKQLAIIYSAADIFINPTREDNFPTVNIEALSCGTPVFTFDTGGSPECLAEGCGEIMTEENMLNKVISFKRSIEQRTKCKERGNMFSDKSRFMEYIDLYKTLSK